EDLSKRYPEIASRVFSSTADLLKLLNKEKNEILTHHKRHGLFTQMEMSEFTQQIQYAPSGLVEPDFRVSKTNALTLNQILGSAWHFDVQVQKVPPRKRAASILQTCQSIDNSYLQLLHLKVISLPSRPKPLLPPIILSF